MNTAEITKTSNIWDSPTDRTPPPLNPAVASALERALPGVNANALIHALDTLTGGRNSFTLVGSASMHLHALEHPNATCSLPIPNDLDVVVNDSAMRRVELASAETLNQLNLKRDPNFKHTLYLSRANQADLKIDLVPASTPGFMKFQTNALSMHGVRIGRLTDSLDDCRTRLKDEDYVEQCGGQAQALAKVQPCLNYFDQFSQVTQPEQQLSPPTSTLVRRPLLNADQSRESILRFLGR